MGAHPLRGGWPCGGRGEHGLWRRAGGITSGSSGRVSDDCFNWWARALGWDGPSRAIWCSLRAWSCAATRLAMKSDSPVGRGGACTAVHAAQARSVSARSLGEVGCPHAAWVLHRGKA